MNDGDVKSGPISWWLRPLFHPGDALRYWQPVHRWFTPARTGYEELPPEDDKQWRLIGRLGKARSWMGYVIWLGLQMAGVVVVSTSDANDDSESATRAHVFHFFASAMMVAFATIIGAAILVAYADRDVRARTARALATPISRAAVWLVAFGFLLAPAAWFGADSGPSKITYGHDSVVETVAKVVWLIFFFRLIMFVVALSIGVISALWNGTKHQFRCIDGHPYLGPVVTLAATWLVVVFNGVTTGVLSAYTPGTPVLLALAITVAGPLVVTFLAVTELRWVRANFPEALRRGSRPLARAVPGGG